jgi:hypothetical protein
MLDILTTASPSVYSLLLLSFRNSVTNGTKAINVTTVIIPSMFCVLSSQAMDTSEENATIAEVFRHSVI